MSRKWRLAAGAGIMAAISLAAWVATPAADDDKPGADKDGKPAVEKKEDKAEPRGREDLPLREYMRVKLAASNMVLEGMCTDDMTLVEHGARKLNEMSTSERWRVSNDPMYRQFSGDFREITQQLLSAAEKKNMDRVTLKWMDATMSCIECHRFVRGIRIADAPAEN